MVIVMMMEEEKKEGEIERVGRKEREGQVVQKKIDKKRGRRKGK